MALIVFEIFAGLLGEECLCVVSIKIISTRESGKKPYLGWLRE